MALTPNNQIEAILAGEDIPVSSRSLAFVKEAVQNGGGSSETYETVAEIQVGKMQGQEGQYSYEAVAENVPEISESETYYLNDESNPSTMVQGEEGSPLIGFNVQFDAEVPSRVNLDEPLVMVAWEDERGRVLVQSDTPDLSNKTVKILKKVSEPSGSNLPEVTSADNGKVLTVVAGSWDKADPTKELPSVSSDDNGDVLMVVNGAWAKASLPENLKPTYEFGFALAAGSDPGTYVATPDSGVTYAAITAALSETPNVYFTGTLPTGEKLRAAVDNIDVVNSFVCANGMFYTGSSFTAYRLKIQSDEKSYIDMKPLANAT